jgi:hypothetical protein
MDGRDNPVFGPCPDAKIQHRQELRQKMDKAAEEKKEAKKQEPRQVGHGETMRGQTRL